VAAGLLGLAACTARAPESAAPPPPSVTIQQPSFTESGRASWYGTAHQGRKTASGERFDPAALTAAHRTLPLGTITRVTSLDSGKSIKVRINDRGPRTPGRIIDLSAEAAAALGLRDGGVGQVRLEVFAADQ
jgi:peptidoglycan lytic transglycosylase